jgi:SAM-dependent methyltransferase
LRSHEKEISQNEMLSKIQFQATATNHWSFSSEWESHFNYKLRKTWGWTLEGRAEQFCLEMEVHPNELNGQLILDAGCGNGQLSEEISQAGATVVAMDFSTSVFYAERNRRSSKVHFVQGDLQKPPFSFDAFDLIYSSGVLHHTPDTYDTFVEVAQLVRPGGRFYVWLYRRPEGFVGRCLVLPFVDLLRTCISRVPRRPQRWLVCAYAFALMRWHKILGKRQDLLWEERVIVAYDTLTPLWRYCHTPWEVSQWFFSNGFSSPTLTHWDNPNGFGVVATRQPQHNTPGSNYEHRAVPSETAGQVRSAR